MAGQGQIRIVNRTVTSFGAGYYVKGKMSLAPTMRCFEKHSEACVLVLFLFFCREREYALECIQNYFTGKNKSPSIFQENKQR